MAYLSVEFKNAQLIWLTVVNKVMVVGLIFLGLACASGLAMLLEHMPAQLNP